MGGLATLGMAVHAAGMAPWLARLNVSSAAALGAVCAATGDLPPFAWHTVATIDGVYLMRGGTSEA